MSTTYNYHNTDISFDFSKETNRLHTNSLKWDVQEHELPMWVADMDFPTAPCVKEAILQKAASGIYGYSIIPNAYFQSIQNWWKTRHDTFFETDWMMFCTGVVPAISSMVRKLTTPAENVLIQSPVYNIFYNSILNNGRNVISSDLLYTNGEYHIDFKDLEEKLALPQTTMMILCNPHNPIGKIWDKETLARIGALCAKHHVIVVSDEIHCDLCDPGEFYVPFASVNEVNKAISITCVSASKAFNLAGLQAACIIVPDPFLRHKVNRGIHTDEVAEPNVFAIEASMAAYEKGGAWLDQLRGYIKQNKEDAIHFCETYCPDIHIISSQATYLLWIDCHKVFEDSALLADFIRQHTGLYVSNGYEYGENGKSFLRMNIACPNSRLQDGLRRLKQGIDLWKKSA